MKMSKKRFNKITDRSCEKQYSRRKTNNVKKSYKMLSTTKKHSKKFIDKMKETNNQLFYIDNQPSTSAEGQRYNTLRKYENQSINTSKYNDKVYYRKLIKRSLGLRTPKKNELPLRKIRSSDKQKRRNFPKNNQSKGLNNEIKMVSQKTNCNGDTLKEDDVIEIRPINTVNEQNNDDDCICIESTIESIVIEDDAPSETIVLPDSFSKCTSSTPLHKKNPCSSGEQLLYFKDIEGKPFMQATNKVQYDTQLNVLGRTFGKALDKKANENAKIDSVIVLDETDISNTATQAPSKDDSVVFVSETKDLEFIPLTSNDVHQQPAKKCIEKCNTPKQSNQIHTNMVSLFTASEKKRLNVYNSNAYNPDAETKQNTSLKRMVIIDGSNVAFSHSLNKYFSVRGIQIVVKYFEKIGHDVKVVVPQFRLGKYKCTEPEELERLHKHGKIVFTPCKNLPGKSTTSYDDRVILQLAFELDAVIISNDNYRDLIHENIAFKKIIENRVVGYSWCNDIFILPKDPYGKWGPSLSSILNRI